MCEADDAEKLVGGRLQVVAGEEGDEAQRGLVPLGTVGRRQSTLSSALTRLAPSRSSSVGV